MNNFTEEVIENLSQSNGESDIVLKSRLDSFKIFQESSNEKNVLFKKYSEREDYNLSDLKMGQGEIEFEIPKTAERAGVKILPISDILNNPSFGALKEKLFNNDDKFSAFSNAFFNCGYFLHVPANTKISSPIIFRTKVGNPTISRGVIFAGENSKFSIMEEIISKNDSPSLQSLQVDIFSEQNSEVDYISLQNLNSKTLSFVNKTGHTKKDSKINFVSGIFGGEKVRMRTNANLQNTGSGGKNFEIVFGNGSQKFDVMSKLVASSELAVMESHTYGIFSGKSSGFLKGNVVVEKGSKNADIHLAQRGMLLGSDSKVDTIPSLEIKEENVKRASHSTSIDQIDENQIFYLQSKGIGETEARKLIMFGFFEFLFKHLDEGMKQKFLQIIEQKFSEENV